MFCHFFIIITKLSLQLIAVIRSNVVAAAEHIPLVLLHHFPHPPCPDGNIRSHSVHHQKRASPTPYVHERLTARAVLVRFSFGRPADEGAPLPRYCPSLSDNRGFSITNSTIRIYHILLNSELVGIRVCLKTISKHPTVAHLRSNS